MDSLELEKIIIVSKCGLKQKEMLDSVAIAMVGGRVASMLYTVTDGDNTTINKDIVEELYDDCYEADEIDSEVVEVLRGDDVALKLSSFIQDNWTSETMVLCYELKPAMFDELIKLMNDIDSDIVINDYHDIFRDKKNIQNDVFATMESLGIKSSMIMQDSIVSLAYFLGMLVDKLHDR